MDVWCGLEACLWEDAGMFVEYTCIFDSWSHEYVSRCMLFTIYYGPSECRWLVPGTWNEG